jgi:hypothetical protein
VELQPHLEPTDVRQIVAASAQKLKHYNKLLKQQPSEL